MDVEEIKGMQLKSIKVLKGVLYPPKNKIAVKVLKITIPVYSNKKKATKIKAEYSVINPATNSDSYI